MKPFLNDLAISTATWQGLERLICRLLVAEGFSYARVIGQSGDGGADVLAIRDSKRWLVQVKHWSQPAGSEVLDRTIAAVGAYSADFGAIASRSGFTADARARRLVLAQDGINIQLWDMPTLLRRVLRIDPRPMVVREPGRFGLREYQEAAVETIVGSWRGSASGSVLAVLATGLGKTFVAAEALRRIRASRGGRLRVLVLAHTNDLVYQLERAWWPFESLYESGVVVNGLERPGWSSLGNHDYVFASRDSLIHAVQSGIDLPAFDVVVVDECHHLGSERYEEILDYLGVGTGAGPFLLGLTATPWRPDGGSLDSRFDGAAVSIDLVWGLRSGFLANVDYRMFTDNVDWGRLSELHGERFSPRQVNRTIFISEWDDAVLDRIHEAWRELGGSARGIVFCGTIEHAERMAARITAIGFANAMAICSRSTAGISLTAIDRNRMLLDFADGKVEILCGVDVLNEGVDVPDVNLIAFQRVTHSRRIFVQQLGRGLRLAPGKKNVVVLDFVSDVRRFAAGLELQKGLRADARGEGPPTRVSLGSKVQFMRASRADSEAEAFLAEWLEDIEAVEEAGEDVSVLRFPPELPPSMDLRG